MSKSNGKNMKYEGKVFIADLAAHREGIIHGVWLNPIQPVEKLRKQIDQMLEESPAVNKGNEWALHDFISLNPYFLGDLAELEAIHEKAVDEVKNIALLNVLIEYFKGDKAAAIDALERRYQGAFDSLECFAYFYMESIGDISDALGVYVDYEAKGRDMLNANQIFIIELDDELHVFLSNENQ